MAHWCETCGQVLPDDDSAESATVLGESSASHIHEGDRSPRVVQHERQSRDRSVVGVIVAVLAIWALFVLGARLVSPGDSPGAIAPSPDRSLPAGSKNQPASTDDGRTGADLQGYHALFDFEDGEVASPDVVGLAVPGLHAVGDRASDELVVGDDESTQTTVSRVQVERLQRQLARRSSEVVIAFRSEDGLAVVDLLAAESRLLDLTDGATAAEADLELLRSGGDTFGIDAATLAAALVVDDAGLLVTRSRSGSTFYVGSDGLRGPTPQVDVVSAGGEAASYLTPYAYQLIAFDGLGLLAVAKGPTGGTLIAGESGFEPLSDSRVLTGNAVAMLEQVCATPIDCTLVVSSISGDPTWTVPRDFVGLGDTYVLSPDGLALLRVTPQGFAEVYLSQSQSVLWVIGAGMEAPAWGPDSNFIAWLDRVGAPKLKVMFPDERDWLTIDLGDLGAPTPAGPELLLFEPTTVLSRAVVPTAERSGS